MMPMFAPNPFKTAVWAAVDARTSLGPHGQHSFHNGRPSAQDGTIVALTHTMTACDSEVATIALCNENMAQPRPCPKLTTPALEPTRRSRPVGASPKNRSLLYDIIYFFEKKKTAPRSPGSSGSAKTRLLQRYMTSKVCKTCLGAPNDRPLGVCLSILFKICVWEVDKWYHGE